MTTIIASPGPRLARRKGKPVDDDEVWTDMRPLSLRLAMGQVTTKTGPSTAGTSAAAGDRPCHRETAA
jgi:hypothetical protein